MERDDDRLPGDVERSRRRKAIEALAREAISTQPKDPTANVVTAHGILSSHSMQPGVMYRRIALFVTAGLCTIAIIGAATVFTRSHPQVAASSGPSPSVVTVSLSSMGYVCPTDATWSPSSEMLAVVVAYADKSGCDAAPHGVLILDASGRKVLFQALDLDSASPGVTLAWAPDGASVVCLVYRPDTSTGGLLPVLRLFPVTTDGSPATIVGASRLFSPDAPVGFSVWDLKSRAVSQTYDHDIAPAQAYRWQPDGQVAPVQGAAPSGYAGSPRSSSPSDIFSFWQPGYIVPLSNSPSEAPQAETYQSLAEVWSPDGRYLAIAAPFRALLPFNRALHQRAPEVTLCHSASVTEACASSPLALPDAAFAAVRVAADAGGHIVAPAGYEGAKLWSVVPVAWRPDGAALAAILPDDGFAAQSQTLRVTLYSTQSGSLIAHLTARRANDGDAAQGMIAPVLMWAPNGKHLSLVDYDSGFITIWSGHALPGGS